MSDIPTLPGAGPVVPRRMTLGTALFYVLMATVIFLGLHLGWVSLRPHIPEETLFLSRVVYDIAYLTIGGALAWAFLRNKQIYARHIANETRLKTFIKYTPAAVAMLDKNMCYLAYSDRWLRDYNIKDADIVGKNHYDLFPQIRDMPQWLDYHRRCLTRGESFHVDEDSFIGLSGKREWLTYDILPWYEMDGTIGGLIFLTEVITARKEAMLKLQESEARFDRAMRGSNDGIWDWDVATDTVYYSPQVAQLLGHTTMSNDPRIETWINIIHPDDKESVVKAWNEHLTNRTPYRAEFRLPTASGDYVWVEGRGQAEWDADGRPLRVAGSIVDISERKRLEQLKQEFVYVVTHELRTPLTALKGAIDMLPLLLGKDVPERVEKMLDLAIQGSNRLMTLINDLLEAGKAESGALRFEMRTIDVVPLLENSLELNRAYADKYQVTFQLHTSVARAVVQIDANRLMQVMANLLSNAAKFSSPGSTVEIDLSTTDDNTLQIAVRDHGIGIAEEFQPRIFEKFSQENHGPRGSGQGTGLGLNITKTIVEKMGGAIRFESRRGEGTTFFVTFPLVN